PVSDFALLRARHALRSLLRTSAFIAAQVRSRYGIEEGCARLHSTIAKRWCFYQVRINFHSRPAFSPAIDVIAGQIRFGVGSPSQINKGLLGDSREDGLQARRDARGEYVFSCDIYDRSVRPFHLALEFFILLPCGDWG